MLREAVVSVLSQSFKDFEVIVVDDGSTDGSQETLEPFGERLRCIYQENQGVSRARNRGIESSSGQFLAFLDSDDLWMKDKLKIQIDFLVNRPLYKICYTDEVWIRQGVRVNPRTSHRKYGGFIFEHVLPMCIISPSSAVLDREVFQSAGLFDEALPACEDYDLWIRVARVFLVGYIPKPLIVKRGGHPDQLTRKFWGLDRFRIRALEKALMSGDLSRRERELVLTQLEKKCRILAKGCRKRGRMEEAQKYEDLPSKYRDESKRLAH